MQSYACVRLQNIQQFMRIDAADNTHYARFCVLEKQKRLNS